MSSLSSSATPIKMPPIPKTMPQLAGAALRLNSPPLPKMTLNKAPPPQLGLYPTPPVPKPSSIDLQTVQERNAQMSF